MSAIRIEVLTEGFRSPNGRAFLTPLVVHRDALVRSGLEISLRQSADRVRDADIVVVDSKYWRNNWGRTEQRIWENVETLRSRAPKLVFADTGDSAGWVQAKILPHVDAYWKGQLLRDRTTYLRPLYGHRLYSDYYHRTKGVIDDQPEWSTPVADPKHLAKLQLGWSSALGKYDWLGPYCMALYDKMPIVGLLRPTRHFVPASTSRPIALHCRMGLSYPRASIAWQRQQIARRLPQGAATGKISRRRYLRELATSRVVVSPFGFGEITLKDFEVLLSGGLLLKPDMSHMDTWPDLFVPGLTIAAHSWDLSDFEEVVQRVLGAYHNHVECAAEGQRRYRAHLHDPNLFVAHLSSLVAAVRADKVAIAS